MSWLLIRMVIHLWVLHRLHRGYSANGAAASQAKQQHRLRSLFICLGPRGETRRGCGCRVCQCPLTISCSIVTCDATCLITSRGHSRFGTFQIELQLECWNYLEHLNVIFRSSHAMDRFSIIIEFHLSKPVLYNPCAENLKYVLYCVLCATEIV